MNNIDDNIDLLEEAKNLLEKINSISIKEIKTDELHLLGSIVHAMCNNLPCNIKAYNTLIKLSCTNIVCCKCHRNAQYQNLMNKYLCWIHATALNNIIQPNYS